MTENNLQSGVRRLDMGVVKFLGGSWSEGTVPATSLLHCRE